LSIAPLPERPCPTIPDQPSAVIYLRVSTKEQAERGGEAEGFSIPAQREACYRKAEQLGVSIVAEFVDAGESARSAARPDLQRMLRYLASEPVAFVLVHKIDRLARNRADDVEINLAIQQAGAALVSCTENIDKTPSGMLLHGIMSSIAEFYSQNLAAEIVKGTETKVKLGGTPTLAPIGYLNVRQTIDGREVRTVEVDPNRAEHVRWAFDAYATGEWTLNQLTAELALRGLTTRPTRTRVAKPLPVNKVHEVLQNRYYTGVVKWRGVEYPGKHEPLINLATFERVQEILRGHRTAGTRPQRHTRYLAGSLFCARCGSRLIYSRSTSKTGAHHGYWLCNGRHNRKNGCQLPGLAEERVESAVVEQWQFESLPPAFADELRTALLADLADYATTAQTEERKLRERVSAIKRERVKWAEKAMEEVVPHDIARAKQTDLAQQLKQAEARLAQFSASTVQHEQLIRTLTTLIVDCGRVYRDSDDETRRAYNQAWFERILLDTDGPRFIVTAPRRTEAVQAVKTAAIRPQMARPSSGTRPDTQKPNGRGPHGYRVHSVARGVITPCLVEVPGIEPGSFVALMGLLRAQCASPLLGPTDHAHKSV
jgi:site-specific DNA recombinase